MVKNGIINKRGVLSIRNSRVEFWENLPPSKRPKSKSFLNVQEAVKNSLKLLKLDLVTVAEVDAFKKECGYLLVDLVEKIPERSYVLDQLLYAMHLSWIQEILL